MDIHLISGHIGAEISGVRLDDLTEEEITGIKEFSNAALAELPIKTWPAKQRKRFNLL